MQALIKMIFAVITTFVSGLVCCGSKHALSNQVCMANEHLKYDGTTLPPKPDSYSERLHVCLVYDTSTSMDGDPMKSLNAETKKLVQTVKADPQALDMLELSLVTFDCDAHVIRGPQPLDNSDLGEFQLEANGTTNIVAGVRKAIQVVETRKQIYYERGFAYFRAVIIVLTDGLPYLEGGKSQDLAGLTKEITEGTNARKFICKFFGTDNADINILRQLSHPDFPPSYVKENDYPSIFNWIRDGIGFLLNSQDSDQEYKQLAAKPVENED